MKAGSFLNGFIRTGRVNTAAHLSAVCCLAFLPLKYIYRARRRFFTAAPHLAQYAARSHKIIFLYAIR